MTVYRGNLTMPPDTTAHDHSTAVSKFLRTVARRSKASSTTTRVLLTVHVTGPDAMHYDTITYSDASKAALRETIRDAWKSAGGKCYSIVGIDSKDEKIKLPKYTTKDTQRAERTSLLPSSLVTNLQRYHANFFTETSKDMLWQQCIKAWFGVPVDDDSAPIVSNIDKGLYDTLDDTKLTPSSLIVSNIDKGLYDTIDTTVQPIVSTNDKGFCDTMDTTIQPISEAEFHANEAKDKHDLREAALKLITQLTPRSEDRALPLHRLARTLSIPEGWLCNLLPSICDLVRTAGGNYWRNLDHDTGTEPTGSRV